MVVAFLAVLTTQFDAGNGAPTKTDLIQWDIVADNIDILNANLQSSPKRFGLRTPEPLPKIGPQPFACGVYDLPSFFLMSPERLRRLQQIYVGYMGSASVFEPSVAKTLNLTPKQSKALKLLSPTYDRNFAFTHVNSRFFSSKGNASFTADACISRHILLYEWTRQADLMQLENRLKLRQEIRRILSASQLSRLLGLAGEPLSAAFYQNIPSMNMASDYILQEERPAVFRALALSEKQLSQLATWFTDEWFYKGLIERSSKLLSPPQARRLFQASLQIDGAFAILRQDISRELGLDESERDAIILALERLSLEANREASDYWWLLKNSSKKEEVIRLRKKLFFRYEQKARDMIVNRLSNWQQLTWRNLLGAPIPGLKSRAHIQ